MKNWLMTIEYDGRGYCGWQRQPTGRTVQAELEKALSIAVREPVKVKGAGRTDAGVHALGQAANFISSTSIDSGRLLWQLNAILPNDIVVRTIAEAPADLDARRSAVNRVYAYFVLNRPFPSAFWRPYSWWVAKPLDIGAMAEAANPLVGVHDFSAFTVAKEGEMRRDLRRINVGPEGSVEGLVRIEIEANAFLHHMVRLIVGTLVEVGVGKLDASDIDLILAAKDVRRAGPRAPAKGLRLERVDYIVDL